MDDLTRDGAAAQADIERQPNVAELKASVLAKLTYSVGKIPEVASPRDWFLAVAFATRDLIVDRWLRSTAEAYADGRKRVYYLSLEFLIGRLLFDAMTNLGVAGPMAEALHELGVNLSELRKVEPDAALGNGGLGRLAACFMDSMATLRIAAHGYGIRYDNGLFRQIIRNGWQQETPEDWLANGNPWEFERLEYNYAIGFGGWVEMIHGDDERTRHIWHPAETVEAVGYDTPIVGWRGKHVNTLRLWSARAPDPFKLDAFNAGDFVGALSDSMRAQAISKVLYPSDATPAGQELRLRQEYFFASASLLDLIRRHVKQHGDVRTIGDYAAIQLNDTHPAIAVAEMMRILVDLNGLEWDEAWKVTQATFSYTNHTLLPEALESWPVPLMERLLPRHMQIIYLINAAHLDGARRRGFMDPGLLATISLIDEHSGRRVRMGNLAYVGSHKINGVSALHTDLMAQDRLSQPEHRLSRPHRQQDQRHHLPPLAHRVQSGPRRHHPLDGRRARARGRRGAQTVRLLRQRQGGSGRRRRGPPLREGRPIPPCRRPARPAHQSGFDVRRPDQAHPRIQAPASQHPRDRGALQRHPRQSDPRLRAAGQDLRGQGGGELYPGEADHQARHRRRPRGQRRPDRARPSQGGVPAKLQCLARRDDHSRSRSLRADLDGRHGGFRNRQHEDGAERRADDRDARRGQRRTPRPRRRGEHLHLRPDGVRDRGRPPAGHRRERANRVVLPALREALDEIASGVFSVDDAGRYRGLVDTLTHYDYFMLCADFDSYWEAQRKVDEAWRDRGRWMRSSIINTANVGWFSSDRTISEYAKEIWNAPFTPVGE